MCWHTSLHKINININYFEMKITEIHALTAVSPRRGLKHPRSYRSALGHEIVIKYHFSFKIIYFKRFYT